MMHIWGLTNSGLSNRYKGALLYGVFPYVCSASQNAPGHINVRNVLRYGVPNKGLYPLRRKSGYPLKAKGVTTFVTPFAYFLSYEQLLKPMRFYYVFIKGG